MSFDVEAVGRSGDEYPYAVTEEALRAYAEATDDVVGGPVFAVLPTWEAAGDAGRSVASEDVRPRIVHYEQDLLLHRPLVAGMNVRTRATPVALLGRPNGTTLVTHTETRDEAGEQAFDQIERVASRDRSQEDAVTDEELQQNVTRLIGTLPHKLRDALLLAGTGEHTYEQISLILGAPVGTVKWRVSEARRVLKRKLTALGYAYE